MECGWSRGPEDKRAYGYSDDGVRDEQPFLPVQDQAARKMPSRLDGCHPGQHFRGYTRRAFDETQRLRRRRLLTEPLLVIY